MDNLISRQALCEYALNQKGKRNSQRLSELPSAQSEHSQNTPQKQPDLETFCVKTGETCADAISRQEVIEIFTQLWDCVGEIADRDEWEDVCKTTANELPSAQRKGKWIYPTDIKGFGRCPHCKALWDYSLISNPFFKFCPRCGNGENEFVELKGEEDDK